MKILKNNSKNKLVLNTEQDFKIDLGWEQNVKELESEILKDIINPSENYETIRYIHKEYEMPTFSGYNQTDIWFTFYFLSGGTYVIDYEPTGLSSRENAKMLRQTTESFFRLEFFKTPNDAAPDRTNRRLVFAKNLSLPLGEKYFLSGSTLVDYIFKPVFNGSNYRNTENMYLFWFKDDSAFSETTITGNTFYVTAKFFNAEDGTIGDFTNRPLTSTEIIDESRDMYYKMIIDRTDYSYQIFNYSGTTTGSRIGKSGNPIVFYEKR